MLSDAGHRAHAFGWPASHPAEPINGVAVSDLFAEYGDEDSVHPPRLVEALRAMRLGPADIDVASLVTLLPRAAELNPAGDQRLYIVAQFLALTASLHAAATWALEHEPWDFAAVRYAGLARLVSLFDAAYKAAQAGERNHDAELFGCLIPNACRFFDMLLRRLIELAGSDASIMLVSLPGQPATGQAAKSRRSHPEPGFFIAAGPAFDASTRLPQASLCDVAPTVLHLYGLPPEPGACGRPMLGMLHHGSPVGAVDRPSKEFDSRQATQSEPPSAPSDDAVAHLLALGYRDQPDGFLRLAIEELDRERLWRLAEAWIDGGQFEQAARVLEELVQLEPKSIAYRSVLAEAYFRGGEFEACRRTIQALLSEGVDTPLARVGLAALDAVESRGETAVEHLKQAEAMGGASAGVMEMIGRLYLGLRRRGDAARAFNATIAADPARATAHEGLAMTCLFSGDPSSAERHSREALKLNPKSYEARCHLGLALGRQDRSSEAIEILREAVAIDPRGAATAHRHLADLLERRGDHAFALHHRALSLRGGRTIRQPQFDFEWFSDDWTQ
jgi:tetratricopeptide (TPR) repeat protein